MRMASGMGHDEEHLPGFPTRRIRHIPALQPHLTAGGGLGRQYAKDSNRLAVKPPHPAARHTPAIPHTLQPDLSRGRRSRHTHSRNSVRCPGRQGTDGQRRHPQEQHATHGSPSGEFGHISQSSTRQIFTITPILTEIMRILFIHQNFPGQFRHLALALRAAGHEVRALAMQGAGLPGVSTVRHQPKPPDAHFLLLIGVTLLGPVYELAAKASAGILR